MLDRKRRQMSHVTRRQMSQLHHGKYIVRCYGVSSCIKPRKNVLVLDPNGSESRSRLLEQTKESSI